MRWKFRHQLSLMFAALVVCLALVGALMTSWGASRALLENMRDQGMQITSGFADQAILALLYGSPENALDAASTTLEFPQVKRVAIYYPNGEILLEQGDLSDWTPSPRLLSPTNDAPAHLAGETGLAWHFLAPVHAPGGQEGQQQATPRIGYVHVALAKDALHGMRRDIFLHNFGSSFLAAAVLLLVLPWLASRVTKPLNELAEQMERAEQGETSVRVRPSGADEVRNMGRVFNRMMETLEQRSQRLDWQNQGLLEQIREREAVERELRLYRDHLQELVDEQTRDLIDARDAALAGERAMSTFIANMSHEIRTPLTAILGFSGILRDAQQSNEAKHDAVDRIVRSGEHLLRLINDILDLSKIAARQAGVEQVPVEPLSVLAEVCDFGEFQAREKGLSFSVYYDFPLPRQILGDPLRLKQILINLVSNAIKFTERGEVKIRIDCDAEREKLYFTVTDTGIGISDEQQGRLFNRFTQADASTTRKYGGSGLGLHISQYFAERLGGDIYVTSTLGKGSRFTLCVATGPLHDTVWIHSQDAMATPAAQKLVVGDDRIPRYNGHVLLAEDNPDNQRLISLYLRQTGARVSLVENGEQAVERALASDFDLILMDIQMPVMDGLSAVKLLRQAGYRAPILVVTANAMQCDAERYRAAGCDGVISKPIELDKFHALLGDYLTRDAGRQTDGDKLADPVERLREDAQFVRLIEDFVGRLPRLRRDIDTACQQRDWKRLFDLVHDLKGMGSSFGYPQLTDMAANIQTILRSKAYDRVGGLVRLLSSAIDRVVTPGHRG